MFMCVVLCICLSLCLCIFATVCQWHCRETSGYLHICQMRFPAAAPPGNLATAFCFQTIRSTVTLNFSKLNNCNWWGKLNCELLLHYCELVLHHCELLLHHCELVLHYCELVLHHCELLLHHCELVSLWFTTVSLCYTTVSCTVEIQCTQSECGSRGWLSYQDQVEDEGGGHIGERWDGGLLRLLWNCKGVQYWNIIAGQMTWF